MDIRKALVMSGVMAAALGVPATAASASAGVFAPPPGQNFGPPANALTATTSITNHPDSGGNGDWATDAFTRTLTIKETGHTGSGASTVYTYTGTVSDTGTFKTISPAFTPNQGGANLGKKIKGTVQGSMTGTANYSFTATSLPTSGRNLGVPGRESGTPTGAQTTSLWFEQAFAAGTNFTGGIGTYSWTYLSGSGSCTQDNGKGNGNGRGNGNGNGFGQGNGFGNRGNGNSPSCSCGDDQGRGRGNGQQKGCTQGHDNQSQGGNNNGRGGNNNGRGGNNNGRGGNNGQGGNNNGRGGRGGSNGSGPSKSSAQKWVDSSSNGDGQQQNDGNITGS
jgi:hypothetical protein